MAIKREYQKYTATIMYSLISNYLSIVTTSSSVGDHKVRNFFILKLSLFLLDDQSQNPTDFID